MRNFFKYSKLKRTTNITTISLGKIVVSLALFIFFNVYFFSGPEHNMTVTLFGPIMFFTIGIIIVKRDHNSMISLRNSYPIDTKKRQYYDILDALLYAVITFLLSVLMFFIIALFLGEITSDETIIEEIPTLHYKNAFNLSIFFFFFFLSSVKNNKNWWMLFALGSISYFLLNTITRYIIIGQPFKRIIVNLTDYSNVLKSVYYFGIIGVFVVSIILFIYFSYYNRKPRKNYINK